jgi:hypothetical protein
MKNFVILLDAEDEMNAAASYYNTQKIWKKQEMGKISPQFYYLLYHNCQFIDDLTRACS